MTEPNLSLVHITMTHHALHISLCVRIIGLSFFVVLWYTARILTSINKGRESPYPVAIERM